MISSALNRRLSPPSTRPGPSDTAALGLRGRLLGATICAALLGFSPAAAPAETDNSGTPEAPKGAAAYLLATPQIPDPLRPLAHAIPAAGRIRVRSAVVTVPDPLETRLGRAFDLQVAALIRAFHSKDYVLDGYALNWNLRLAQSEDRDGGLPPDGTLTRFVQPRAVPSVLVFRRDLWRKWKATRGADEAGAEYFVPFLVGDSPTAGVPPAAFRTAAICAALLSGRAGADRLSAPCIGTKGALAKAEGAGIDVLGPAFSGSMDSVAIVLGRLLAEAPGLRIALRSPSASVKSNAHVPEWIASIAGHPGNVTVTYHPFADSLEQQLRALAVFRADHGISGTVAILAEDSTFGHGVDELIRPNESGCRAGHDGDKPGPVDSAAHPTPWDDFVCHVRVANFPQNIAVIRAEHSRLARERSASLRKALNTQSELLELDLSGMREAVDRPPAYQASLSSRSDELMLYGLLDALRVWARPQMVAIVATDIRDRLFLLNEIRKELPWALPVLLEMDYLSAHPDYRKITRGALVVQNGDTMLCMEPQGDILTDCQQGGRDAGSGDRGHKLRLSFPADYAANMFRAAIAAIDAPGGQGPSSAGAIDSRPPKNSELWVATLAGFQSLEPPGHSRLLAAGGRLLLEAPLTLGVLGAGLTLLFIALWLGVHGEPHLAMVSPLRLPHPFPAVPERDSQPFCGQPKDEKAARLSPAKLNPWIATILFLLAAAVFELAWVRLAELFSGGSDRTWDLVHGRDWIVLLALLLLYFCLAVVAWWRLYLWRRRCLDYLKHLGGDADEQGSIGQGQYFGLGLWGLALLAPPAAFALYSLPYPPTAVDPVWPAVLADSVLLTLAPLFALMFWIESKRLAWFAQRLAPTAELPEQGPPTAMPHGPLGVAIVRGWANPQGLASLPQSPFSLCLRERDLKVLLDYPEGVWAVQTRALLAGSWPRGRESYPGFRCWQLRTAAELRCGAVAIRSAAWCALLAPAMVLIGMGVYPPVFERQVTIASIALIVAAFVLVIYEILKLDRHPLLGPMFTRGGDRLSIGGIFGALWTKLAAAALILIPVLFPDALSHLYQLLQSVNSLP
jgi:hypothetical protein